MNDTIIIAIIGSGALSTIISAIITAVSNRRSRLKKIEEKLTAIEKNQQTAEKDTLRTQLLLMIADYPEEKTDILRLAEHYFKDLEGNWVASSVFNHWIKDKCGGVNPEWLKN